VLYLLYLVYLVNGGYVRAVQRVPTTALVTCLLVLGALGTTTGLDGPGRGVGLLCAAVVSVALGVATTRHRTAVLGPADRVTLVRCALACGVAALTADSFSGSEPGRVLVGVAAVALVLDWVDGQVARRTGTASGFGAAFDMEVDAFLLLVLSVFVGPIVGWWVLAIGLMYYGFVVAGWAMPWMRVTLPPRYWRKVVTAACGIALTIVAAGILPGPLEVIVALAAVALVVESFGRDVIWLVRARHPVAGSAESSGPGSVHRLPSR
jgi:phosphatidylglycerophosphate synthase